MMARRNAAAVLAILVLLVGCADEPESAPGAGDGVVGDSGNGEGMAAETLRRRIRTLAREGAPARAEIDPFLTHTHPAAREEAAVVYPRVAEGNAAPALAKLATDDPEPNVRAAAVTAIGHMRAMDEMDAVVRALEDPDWLVRRRAADAASRITGQRYEVNVPPEEWRRTVEEIRALWQNHEEMLRTYHERHNRPPRR
jgi:hypothetical protein